MPYFNREDMMDIMNELVERVSDALLNSLASAAPLVQIRDGLKKQLISGDEAIEELECRLGISRFIDLVLEKMVSKLAA